LQAQQAVQKNGPPEVKNLELISEQDLEEIRRLWVMEKHEIEDNLPKIYQRVMGKIYPGKRLTMMTIFIFN